MFIDDKTPENAWQIYAACTEKEKKHTISLNLHAVCVEPLRVSELQSKIPESGHPDRIFTPEITALVDAQSWI